MTDREQYIRITKDAIMGLIGDNVKKIDANELYRRVCDQCDRSGLYNMSWSLFIDVAEIANIKFRTHIDAILPKRKQLF
jgi:hypothetical protein